MKLLVGFIVTSAFLAAGFAGAEVEAVSDVASMTIRSDGKYDVTCKNGTQEIATADQIHNDSVCGGPGAQANANIEALFSRPQGDYYVLCKNKAWETATAAEVRDGKVCKGVPANTEKLTALNGREYFTTRVQGNMLDINVLAACKAVGMTVPCVNETNGDYSDGQCLDVGVKDGTNPMMSLAIQLCGSDRTPGTCAALAGVFHYMGMKWSDKGSCGALNGIWCTTGSTTRDQFALCVKP